LYKEAVVAGLEVAHYPYIYMNSLNKHENIQLRHSPDQDLNPGRAQYGVLPTQYTLHC